MIYGFAYLALVLGIALLWLFLAVLPKPFFIEKPLEELKETLREFLGSNDDKF